jgi:hyperosmotically inducible periplasmic protein
MNTRTLVAIALASTFAVAGCSKPPEVVTAPPAAVAVSDTDVTSNVRTALQGDSAVKGFDISVTTLNGDVKLSGMVDTQAQVDQALMVARAVPGVNAIQDELKLKK